MQIRRILSLILTTVMLLSLCTVYAFAGDSDEPESDTVMKENVISFDFEGDKELMFQETDMVDYFYIDAPLGDQTEIGEDAVAILAGFSDIYTNEETSELLNNQYEVNVSYKSKSSQSAGLYFRAVDPALYAINNSVLGVDMQFCFYELDWYTQCGGKEVDSATTTGGSGIKISVSSKNVIIAIKVYAPDGLHTATRSVKIPAPNGKSSKDFINFKVTDNDNVITIYAEDSLLCTVEYGGEPGEYELSETYEEGTLFFYKHAEIKNAAGEVLLTVEDAKIAAENPVFAIGNRDSTTYFNNLQIKYLTEVPKATPSPKPTDVPATQEPVATEEPQPATEIPEEHTEKSSGSGALIAVIAGVAVVAAIAVGVVVSKKKKK